MAEFDCLKGFRKHNPTNSTEKSRKPFTGSLQQLEQTECC